MRQVQRGYPRRRRDARKWLLATRTPGPVGLATHVATLGRWTDRCSSIVGTFVPTELSRGPWSPTRCTADRWPPSWPTGSRRCPRPDRCSRPGFTLELLRPVALEPMRIETAVVRPGRKVQVLEARLHRDRRSPVGRLARGPGHALQQIREQAVDLPPDTPVVRRSGGRRSTPPERLSPAAVVLRRRDRRSTPPRSSTARPRGRFATPGPAVDWIRVVVDLLPGDALAPFERVVAAADFGNGISGMLPVPEYLFVNPDLSVFLYRLPVDEWVGLDAVTHLGPGRDGGGRVVALRPRRLASADPSRPSSSRALT